MQTACLDCLAPITFEGESLISSVLTREFPRSARCIPCYRKWRVERSMVDDLELKFFHWAVQTLRRKGCPPPPERVHQRLTNGPYGGQWEMIMREWELRAKREPEEESW